MTGGDLHDVSPVFLEAMEIAMGMSEAAPGVEHLEAAVEELARLNVHIDELEFAHAQFEALEDQNAALRVENRRAREKALAAENIMLYAGLKRAARAGRVWRGFWRTLGALGLRG